MINSPVMDKNNPVHVPTIIAIAFIWVGDSFVAKNAITIPVILNTIGATSP